MTFFRIRTFATFASIGLLIYMPCITIPPVQDAYIVIESTFSDLGKPFFTDSYYRPVVTLSGWLTSKVAPASPVLFNLTNLMIHIFNSFLLSLWLMRRFEMHSGLASAAGLVFLVHPAGVIPSAWIAGRCDLFALMFLLLFLIELARAPSMRVYLCSTLWLFLAFFSKETAYIGVPLGVVAVESGVWPKRNRRIAEALFVVVASMTLLIRAVVLSPVRFAGPGLGLWEEVSPDQIIRRLIFFLSRTLVWLEHSGFESGAVLEASARPLAAGLALFLLLTALWHRSYRIGAVLVLGSLTLVVTAQTSIWYLYIPIAGVIGLMFTLASDLARVTGVLSISGIIVRGGTCVAVVLMVVIWAPLTVTSVDRVSRMARGETVLAQWIAGTKDRWQQGEKVFVYGVGGAGRLDGEPSRLGKSSHALRYYTGNPTIEWVDSLEEIGAGDPVSVYCVDSDGVVEVDLAADRLKAYTEKRFDPGAVPRQLSQAGADPATLVVPIDWLDAYRYVCVSGKLSSESRRKRVDLRVRWSGQDIDYPISMQVRTDVDESGHFECAVSTVHLALFDLPLEVVISIDQPIDEIHAELANTKTPQVPAQTVKRLRQFRR